MNLKTKRVNLTKPHKAILIVFRFMNGLEKIVKIKSMHVDFTGFSKPGQFSSKCWLWYISKISCIAVPVTSELKSPTIRKLLHIDI